MRTTHLLLSILFLALLAAQAEPSVITFFGEDQNPNPGSRLFSHPNADAARASFLSYLTDVGTEHISPTGNILNFGVAGRAIINGGGGPIFDSMGPGLPYPISGNFSWQILPSSMTEFEISFLQPVVAFGFYGVDIGDLQGQLTVTATGPLNIAMDVPHSIGGFSGSVLFWGFLSTEPSETFNSVRLSRTGSTSDAFGFDDFTIGSIRPLSAVPEPAASPLLALSLAGLVAFKARKGGDMKRLAGFLLLRRTR